MLIFSTGIKITEVEYRCLLHVTPDPEQWLRDVLAEKVVSRREALIEEWRPKLFVDPNITTLPADRDALVRLIMDHSDYRTRLQSDAEQVPSVVPSRYNIARFEGRSREGQDFRRPERDPSVATITLFPSGIDILDADANCIMAYVQDLDDWVLGALLGHINRGKKKMIAQYQPMLMADPDVTDFPADEGGLIAMIVTRSDYLTIPEQIRTTAA